MVHRPAKLLVYFKVHARRVIAEIGSPDPLEALGSALKALIEDQGGKLEATATEIYQALQEAGCEVLPAAPRVFMLIVSSPCCCFYRRSGNLTTGRRPTP